MTTTTTRFESDSTWCTGWVTPGRGDGPRPGIVLVHGLGATHEMVLGQYEDAFAAAGITVLSFDFRHLGASGGEPRQLVSLRRHLQDVDAAWRHLRGLPGVDPARVALWGTSLGATHVLRYAARQPEAAAAVIQCPVVHGPSSARRAGPGPMIAVMPDILRDLGRALTRRPRHYTGIVGEPGDSAVVTIPGVKAKWEAMMPEGYRFDNRVTAASGLELVLSRAAHAARRISCPLLVCVCDREQLMNPRIADRVAARAARGTALHYDADHFDVYHPPLADQVIGDQVAFLAATLSPDRESDR